RSISTTSTARPRSKAPGRISSVPWAVRCRKRAPRRRSVTMAKRIVLFVVMLAIAAGGGMALYLVHRPAGETLPSEDGAPARHQKYQCAMHPQIVSDEPGTCPICGMKLQPVEEAAAAQTGSGRTIAFYRHPMRPEVTSAVPAKDEMGMDYVPVYTDELQGGQAPASSAPPPGH